MIAMRCIRPAVALAGAALLLSISAAAPVSASMTPISAGHTDIDIEVHDGEFEFHWHTDADLFEPDEAFAFGDTDVPGLTLNRPAGSQWDFFGVSAGAPLYIFPFTENEQLPFLGIGTEEIGNGVLVDDEVTLSLTGFSVLSGDPSEFSLYTTDSFGQPNVRMATSDGINPALDQLVLPSGTHAHFNWAFTGVGLYAVDFEATGTLVAGNTPISGSGRFLFQIGAVPIPEPTGMALMALGGGTLALAAVRRRRRQG